MKHHYFKHLLLIMCVLFVSACQTTERYKASDVNNISKSEVRIIRPADILTLTQGVQLEIDGKFVEKIWHDQQFSFLVDQGIHEVRTSVGFSLGLPNITGFNGARDFETSFKFNKATHFFKISFEPGLFGGQHIVTEIDSDYFESLIPE